MKEHLVEPDIGRAWSQTVTAKLTNESSFELLLLFKLFVRLQSFPVIEQLEHSPQIYLDISLIHTI